MLSSMNRVIRGSINWVGLIQFQLFPNTRDDSAEHPPLNFLYTDETGALKSSTSSLVAGAGAGLTPEQENAITANSAKVGITPTQAAAIVANSAKVGITPTQAAAIIQLQNDLSTHSHPANEITITPAGNLTSLEVQAALVEHQADIDALAAIGAANYFALDADPLAGDLTDGDYVINASSGDIFGPKAGGVWGASIGNAYQTALSNATPEANSASGGAGISSEASRADHFHAMPSLDDLLDVTGASVDGAFVITKTGNDYTFTAIEVDKALDNLTDVTGATEDGDYILRKAGSDYTLEEVQAAASQIDTSNISSGYAEIGDMLMQWGNQQVSASGNQPTVITFPTPFGAGPVIAVPSLQWVYSPATNPSLTTRGVVVAAISPTILTVRGSGDVNAIDRISWHAFGPKP